MRRTAKKCALVVGFAVGSSVVGYDFWRYSEYQRALNASESLTRHYDEKLEASELRLADKDAAVRDFLDRRATFAEVVEQFRRLNEENGQVAATIRADYPAADDREVAARNALNFIRASLSHDPSRQRAALSHLHAEFARLCPRAASNPRPAG